MMLVIYPHCKPCPTPPHHTPVHLLEDPPKPFPCRMLGGTAVGGGRLNRFRMTPPEYKAEWWWAI